MLSLTFDNESNLICNTSGKTRFTFATSTGKRILKHAYRVFVVKDFFFVCVWGFSPSSSNLVLLPYEIIDKISYFCGKFFGRLFRIFRIVFIFFSWQNSCLTTGNLQILEFAVNTENHKHLCNYAFFSPKAQRNILEKILQR